MDRDDVELTGPQDVAQRDYSKFLDDRGLLQVKLLPRKAYTAIVNEYRREPEIIQDVFEELYFLWDLEQELEKMTAEGREPDHAAAAQKILNSMDDGDWWRVMAAFERRAIRRFGVEPERWAAMIDPIYDDQEANGWRHLQP